jgi:hypothetical protein
MNAQAEQMLGFVDELVALVGGDGNGAGGRRHGDATPKVKKISQALHLPQKQKV